MKTIWEEAIGVFKRADKLNSAMALPAREGLMLMDDISEPRGSDYDEETLKTPVGDLEDDHNAEVADEIQDQEYRWGEKTANQEYQDECIENLKGGYYA